MKTTLILSTLFFGACALRLAPYDDASSHEVNLKQKSQEILGNTCPQEVNSKHWGLWIDGRDGKKGEFAYGEKYSNTVIPGLQYAYDQANLDRNTPLTAESALKMFEKIAHFVRKPAIGNGNPYRTRDSPIMGDVVPCHKKIPASALDKIMSTVTVVDRKYKPSQARDYHKEMLTVFRNYMNEVEGTSNKDTEIRALAKLEQNLAYLHPLGDANGRSRLLLLNYMLRRRGIACGTMMWNNNKNIYFETRDQFATHIKEGIETYNAALETNFRQNPWQDQEVRQQHLQRAQQQKESWSDDIEKCFQGKIGGGAKGTSSFGFKVKVEEIAETY